MKTVGVIQARMGSSRLPGKSMLDLGGSPVAVRVVERALAAEGVDEVTVATTEKRQDDIIEWAVDSKPVSVFRGSEVDVLGRVHGAAEQANADVVVRISADNPLVSPPYLSTITDVLQSGDYDYVSSADRRTFPLGLTAEAFTADSLERVERTAKEPRHREHVTPYYRESDEFAVRNVDADEVFEEPWLRDRTDLRLTLDRFEDYRLLSRVYSDVDFCETLPAREAIRYIDDRELGDLNQNVAQKSVTDTETDEI